LADGIDPGQQRQAEREARADTFAAVAADWLERQRASMTTGTAEKAQWQLSLVPELALRPVSELTAPEVLRALRKIEAKGTHETAHRVKQRIGQVMRYAITVGLAERDPTADLRGALAPVVTTPRAAV